MAELWGDIERDLASASRHYAMAIEGFKKVRSSASDAQRCFTRAAFMHAMLAGYTSFGSAMRRLTSLLGEELPVGSDRHRALIERLAEPIEGGRPAVFEDDRLLLAIDALRGFRHVAAHACDRSDEDRAAVAVIKAETLLAGIGPALARFRSIIDPDQPPQADRA